MLPQRPGSFYVGNLCAASHRVRHLAPLPGSAEMFTLAVMFRTDVFRAERSRAMKVKPKPAQVFDIVNEVVASRLAARPLGFPCFSSVLTEHSQLA